MAVSGENFGITLLTHRADEKEDGYFMLLVSPKYEVKQTEIVEKDFIFVLDRSGSMARRKVEQAKAALPLLCPELERRRPVQPHPV